MFVLQVVHKIGCIAPYFGTPCKILHHNLEEVPPSSDTSEDCVDGGQDDLEHLQLSQ